MRIYLRYFERGCGGARAIGISNAVQADPIFSNTFGSHLDAKLEVQPPKPGSVIVSPTTGLPAGKGNEGASVRLK